MKHAPRIATIWGIPVRVHWSFLALLALLLVSYARGPLKTMLLALAWFVAVFASVVVHEFAHSVVARRRGLTVRDIVLLPIGGVSEILRLRRGSRDELDVSLAGPLASFGLAALLLAAGALGGLHLWPPTLTARSLVVRTMWANVLLGAFNLLPALPFDGGHVLRAALSRRVPESRATSIAARAGLAFGYAMIVVGALVDFWLAVIGVFVLLGASAERQVAEVRERLGDRRVRDVMVPCPSTLDGGLTVEDARAFLPERSERSTPVERDAHYLGMIAAKDIARASSDTLLEQCVDRTAPLLSLEDDLYPDAVAAFAQSGRHELAVGKEGRVLGILYEVDVESLVRRATDASGQGSSTRFRR